MAILGAALVLAIQVPQSPSPERYSQVLVDPAALASRPQLLGELGFDHIAFDRERGALEFAASASQLDALAGAGVPFTVEIEDLAGFYAARLTAGPDAPPQFGAWLTPPFGSGSMGGYYTYAEVGAVLDQLHAAYPTLTTAKASIGTTGEGRSIWMLKVSDNAGVDENEPEVRFDALHHAREPEGMQASLWCVLYLLERYNTDPLARYLVDERELYYVPVVNADGYVYNQTTNPGGGGMWRKNRRNNGSGVYGVDLNRNYANHWGYDNSGSSPTPSSETYRGPSAASEPETQALQAFILARQFGTALSIHTYSNLWLYPYGYAAIYPANNAQYLEVSQLATEVNQYVIGPPPFVLYTVNGGSLDYEHDAKGTLAWSPELGSSADGFWPPTSRIVPLADENLLALQRTALAAGAWARVASLTLAEVGDGDGFYEAGESLDVTALVRNSGRLATATGVVSTLSTTSPYATVTGGSHAFGALAGFSQASSAPLSLAISPNAPGGCTIDLVVTTSYEGWSQVETRVIQVGAPIPFVIDDAELDWGWTKTLPGDTATGGKWTRGAPIGTSSSGQPANPATDATPAPGTQCYLTGNGGGSAGNDDVDNGFTTLLSPVFDLSNCGAARLSYSRWFADLTVADDVFAVSISNNGGASWTPLENVAGNANAWNRVSFDVSSVIAPTASMRLRFVAADSPNNSVVEAAVDDLEISIFDSLPRLNVYGTPTLGASVRANITGPAGASFALRAKISDPSAPAAAAVGRACTLATGTIPATRLAQVTFRLPSDASWAGHTLYFRAATSLGTSTQLTNWAAVTLQ